MISLHEPRFSTDDEDSVIETLRSSWVSTGGQFVERFEREFAAYVGLKHAISVSNGTIALFLSLEVLKRLNKITGPFDVLVPTLSFIATANSVCHSGGTSILIDCAPNSVNIDPNKVLSTVQAHYVRSDNGAQVDIDGGLHLVLGSSVLLRAGNYHVRATAPGYHALEQEFSVKNGNNELPLRLEKLPGLLALRTEPVEARVLVDGTRIGDSNAGELEIPAGLHRLRVEADRFLPLEQDLAVEALASSNRWSCVWRRAGEATGSRPSQREPR